MERKQNWFGRRDWREGVGIEPTNDGVTAAYRF